MYKSSFTFPIILLFTMIVSAGPNSNAEVYINFGSDTSSIDSVTYCSISDTITAAIQVNNAVSLYDFEFYVSFDTAHLQFITGTKENSESKNFLESLGGNTFFKCSPSKDDSTKILTGASILGGTENECPNGSGFLSFMTFRKKTSDTTSLVIYKSLLETYSAVPDTMIKTTQGLIIPGSAAILRHCRKQNRFSIQKTGNIVTIYSPEIIPRVMQLFSIDGRCVKRITDCSQRTSFALPSLSGTGYYVLRISSSNSNFSSLVINN